MIRRPPGSTRTDTLFPYTTLFRSGAFALLRRHLPSSVPVIFGRAVGRTDEMVRTVRLQDASADMADMATCIIVGSPETRIIERDGKAPLVYSPRSYRGGSACAR